MSDKHDSKTDPCRTGQQCDLSAAVPQLPAWKAFVVQFSRETEGMSAAFSGRVEHLSSGRRVRFGSVEDLVAVLRRLLTELGEPRA